MSMPKPKKTLERPATTATGVSSVDDFFMSKVDRSNILVRYDDVTMFNPLSREGKSVLKWMKSQHARRVRKWERGIEPPQDVDGEKDLLYLKSLDPVEWKEQDHYQVMGLRHLRHRASDEDIKKAYRNRVLRHHPDKRQSAGETINPEGDYFACIVKAYEILAVASKRRSYDSIDPHFDDYTPPKSVKSPEEFFSVYGKWFALNARWSVEQPAPLLGNIFSTRNQVDDFYQFWFELDSWREYSYLDEEDKEKGESREERRWIEKQNKAERAKLKKEEMSRIRSVVEQAWGLDPRIPLFKEMDRREKLEKKLARQKALQDKNDELEKIRLEQEQKVREDAEKIKAQEREEEAAAKRIKEAQKKALKKERKTFRTLCKSHSYYGEDDKSSVENMAASEKLCEVLQAQELAKVNQSLANLNFQDGKVEFEKVVRDIGNRTSGEKSKTTQDTSNNSSNGGSIRPAGKGDAHHHHQQWSHDELQLLIKAVNLFPAGTAQRWEVVANFINQHYHHHHNSSGSGRRRGAKEVLAKAKDLNSSDFSKNRLKEEVNQKAYELFEKNIKHPSAAVVVESEETKRDDNEAAGGGRAGSETVTFSTSAETISKAWTAAEQKLFEQALKTYPSSGGDRWEKVAECLPGRSKKECVARYKELAALVKAKKSATAIK